MIREMPVIRFRKSGVKAKFLTIKQENKYFDQVWIITCWAADCCVTIIPIEMIGYVAFCSSR